MEDAEVPLEQLHEEIHHRAEHASETMDFLGGPEHRGARSAGGDSRTALGQSREPGNDEPDRVLR